jgi:predicted nucleotidyltransferase
VRPEDPTEAVTAALLADPDVVAVTLCGSRAAGTATPLSDWDFQVRAGDARAVASRLPRLVAPLAPRAALWDPLAPMKLYMVLLVGAVKLDLFLDLPAVPAAEPEPLSPERLVAVDWHFWDWTLWLAAKRLRGEDGLVRRELDKMARHILRPLGADVRPRDQPHAVACYLRCREDAERRWHRHVDRRLGDEVMARLAECGLLARDDG